MLDIAVSNGTTHIVLTPHYLARDKCLGLFSKEELKERFETFKEKALERFSGLKIYFGAEMMAVDNFQDVVSDGQLITLNDSRYVLIEFGFNDRIERANEIINKVVSFNKVPIIAHPERYLFVQENPSVLEDFMQNGGLLQLNATSLLGLSGPIAERIANNTLRDGLASFVASDAHSIYRRTPDLSDGYVIVSSKYGRSLAEAVFYSNPLAVVNDEKLPFKEI